jgi:hypothetical protein
MASCWHAAAAARLRRCWGDAGFAVRGGCVLARDFTGTGCVHCTQCLFERHSAGWLCTAAALTAAPVALGIGSRALRGVFSRVWCWQGCGQGVVRAASSVYCGARVCGAHRGTHYATLRSNSRDESVDECASRSPANPPLLGLLRCAPAALPTALQPAVLVREGFSPPPGAPGTALGSDRNSGQRCIRSAWPPTKFRSDPNAAGRSGS